MRLLVLGGTRFLSREVAAAALRRGHEVTCACRGTAPVPAGAVHLAWDRNEPAPPALLDAAEPWDAVVDVARLPSQVRRALAAAADAHWVFVSTISVYPDHHLVGGPEDLRVHEPTDDEANGAAAADPEAYGPLKVACEELVRTHAASSVVVRPGLIVGPGDPTGRFTYWVERVARAQAGEQVLAPGRPEDTAQVIDVRDLAAWLVDLAEARATGTVDAVGPVTSFGELLGQVCAGVGAQPQLTWVPQGFLLEHDVAPWAGPRSLPLFLPRPEYDGMLAHDATPAIGLGLRPRPIAETARDTLVWLREHPDAERTGLTSAEEADVLNAWHTLGS